MLKVILFDVGGTLIDPYPSIGDIYSQIAKRHGHDISPEDLTVRFEDAWSKRKGTKDPIDKMWWRFLVREVFEPYSIPNLEALFDDLFHTFMEPSVWGVYKDVVPTLRKLLQWGIQLAIASNWDSRLPTLLERLKLAPYFRHQFISFALGINKCDTSFYMKCLENLKIQKASEVIHIGDDEFNDVLVPKQIGIRAYQIDRRLEKRTPTVFKSLYDFLSGLNINSQQTS